MTGSAHGAAGLLVGMDIGGTKTHVRAGIEADHPSVDTVVSSRGWVPRPERESVQWIDDRLRSAGIDDSDVVALVVGAHGYDTEEQAHEMRRALSATRPYPCSVVNDALLLAPAAGIDDGIGLIVGTGSIALGRSLSGETVYAGGWGWQLGDEGSAPVLVREAVRAVLRNQEMAGAADVLAQYLVEALSAGSVMELPERLRIDAGAAAWGVHAPTVFSAAAAGSALANQVIADAGRQLAELIERLRARGVTAEEVVAAGGVIVGQPALARAVRDALAAREPDTRFQVLSQPPVLGAMRLAGRLRALAH